MDENDKKDKNSPLVGYNTNVRHAGILFHIQTEDSGRDRPHLITHLFTEGTILATKKTPYDDELNEPDWEPRVRQMMKDQHRAMFVELRDGAHDEIASKILGVPVGETSEEKEEEEGPEPERLPDEVGSSEVRVIRPAEMRGSVEPVEPAAPPKGRSIFEAPEADGSFGEDLMSDKSLDEVILTYLSDDLDE
ncbi:MAG: hypothetical protein R6V85_21660 [Polyangia bacterium]